ncbi:flagellar biosynthesis anti-sigma factor FlgM [Marinomonas agarivorans]|nr:flagellar biosynthesis anti-sigma factor FlgM [Marinomonas agarivorans]
MTFNINGYNNQPNITKNDRLQRSNDDLKNNSTSGHERSNTLTDDTVNLSNAAQTLQQQKNKIDSLPDMNMEKVEQIKQAIAAGQYRVDTDKLASNMVAMDSIF